MLAALTVQLLPCLARHVTTCERAAEPEVFGAFTAFHLRLELCKTWQRKYLNKSSKAKVIEQPRIADVIFVNIVGRDFARISDKIEED